MTTFQKWLLISITVIGIFGAVVINNAISTSKQNATETPKAEVKSEQTTQTQPVIPTTTQPQQPVKKQITSPTVSVTTPTQTSTPNPTPTPTTPTTPTEPPKPPEIPFTASLSFTTPSPRIHFPFDFSINANRQLSNCTITFHGVAYPSDYFLFNTCGGSVTINIPGAYEVSGTVHSTDGAKTTVWSLITAIDYGF